MSSPFGRGRRLSSSSSTSQAPSITDSSATKTSSTSLFQQTTSALQTFALESVISASAIPPRLPVSQTKEPLSLPATTKNFRGFVQKSGPIFWFQDGIQATLMWQHPSWTLMWMAIWALVSVYPWLLVLAPSAALSVILIMTHRARFNHTMVYDTKQNDSPQSPSKSATNSSTSNTTAPDPASVLMHATLYPTSTGEGPVLPPLVPNPPHEGSIKYYENLRDIQNMMKMVTDGYDLVVPVVPYLNWSSYTRSLHVLQLSILVTILLFFIAPYIPYRLVLFLTGESVFILNHPWTLPVIEGIKTRIDTSREGRKLVKKMKENKHRVREWIEQDRLDDFVWERGWRNVEMFENERFLASSRATSSTGQVSGWSGHNLRYNERRPWTKGPDGWSSEEVEVLPGHRIDVSRQVAMTLEPGWEWVPGDDWRIDWGGNWSTVGVDDEGYVYTDSSWQRPSPYPYGHGNGNGIPNHPPLIYDDQQQDETSENLKKFQTGSHDPKIRVETRKRRWLRRAVRVQ